MNPALKIMLIVLLLIEAFNLYAFERTFGFKRAYDHLGLIDFFHLMIVLILGYPLTTPIMIKFLFWRPDEDMEYKQ